MKKLALLLTLVLLVTVMAVPASAATGEAKIKFDAGNLEFDTNLAALKLDFGTHAIDGLDLTHTIGKAQGHANGGVTGAVSVTDLRGLANGVWKVTVALDGFMDAATPVLASSSIEMKTNAMTTLTPGPGINAPSTLNTVTLLTDSAAHSFIESSVANHSVGTWTSDTAGATEIEATLAVPAASVSAGTAIATMTWILSDTL